MIIEAKRAIFRSKISLAIFVNIHLFAHSFVPMAKNFIAFEKANIKCDNKQNSHEIIQNVETDTYFVCPEQSGHNKFYIEYLMKSLTLL